MIRIRLTALCLVAGAVLAACGGPGVATAPPATPTPEPTPTPNPHLIDPASVDKVYQALRKAGLPVTANSANAGTGGEPLKRLNLTYDGWPLIIQEFSSADALRVTTKFSPKHKPQFGDPAYTFIGLNLYIEYGPHTTNHLPETPDQRFIDAAMKLVAVLDPLIGPLRQSSVSPIPLPTAPPASPAPSASGPAGSASPSVSP